jgi:DNA-binding SARP family transcriptional activator
MTNVARRLRGLATLVAASLGLLVLVAGVPLGLALGIGFPGTLPTWGDVVHQLQIQGVPIPLVLYTLAFICWLLWAYLMWSLIAEAVVQMRRSEGPRGTIARPGRGVAGPLITALVVGAHLLVSRSALQRPAPNLDVVLAPRPVAAALYTPSTRPSLLGRSSETFLATSPSASPSGTKGEEVEVRPGDTLWGIASRELHNPREWPVIWEANRDRREDDGRVFTDPSLIQPGWELEVPEAGGPAPTEGAPLEPGEPASPGTPSTPSGAVGGSVPAAPSGPADVRVAPGDTLWALAGRDLGNPAEWPRIWEANEGRQEPGGRRFTDPSRIYPGWELEVPGLGRSGGPRSVPGATSEPSPSEVAPSARATPQAGGAPPEAPRAPASPRAAPSSVASPAPTRGHVPPRGSVATPEVGWLVTLVEGGVVGLSLAAAVVAALTAVNRYERRHWRVGSGTQSYSATLAMGPNLRRLRVALAPRVPGKRKARREGERAAIGEKLLTALRRGEALPGAVPVGFVSEGEGDVILDVEQLSGLCLDGPGAAAALRALIVSLLAHNPNALADLAMVDGPEGAELIPGLSEHPGVHVYREPSAVLARLESAVQERRRSLGDQQGFREALTVDGALSALLAILPAASIEGLPDPRRLALVIAEGRRCGIGVLCLGTPSVQNAELRRLVVGEDGSVQAERASLVAGARRLYHLARDEARELLRVVTLGDGPDLVPELPADHEAPPPEPPASQPPPVAVPVAETVPVEEGKPVEVHIFGGVRVLVRGERVRFGIPSSGYEVLALLVVKGRALTRDEGVDALGEGDPGSQFQYRWVNGVRKTRQTLREMIGGNVNCILCENGLYELDRSLVDSDYWRVLTGIQAARSLSDPHEKRLLLEEATRGIEGEPLAHTSYSWLSQEEEDVRQRVMRAFAELAELQAAEGETDAAITTLERALTLDPNPVEDLFRRMMLIQHRSGRDQGALDTYAQLRAQLRSRLEADPDEETEELMRAIKARRPRLAD